MANAPPFHNRIVGEKLSAITFVLDYWQFQFDGPSFNALTRVTVRANGATARDGDDQFRNPICGQIGKVVAEVTLVESDAFTIVFGDRSSISISLKSEDYVEPEAVVFYSSNQIVVIRDDDIFEFDKKA